MISDLQKYIIILYYFNWLHFKSAQALPTTISHQSEESWDNEFYSKFYFYMEIKLEVSDLFVNF